MPVYNINTDMSNYTSALDRLQQRSQPQPQSPQSQQQMRRRPIQAQPAQPDVSAQQESFLSTYTPEQYAKDKEEGVFDFFNYADTGASPAELTAKFNQLGNETVNSAGVDENGDIVLMKGGKTKRIPAWQIAAMKRYHASQSRFQQENKAKQDARRNEMVMKENLDYKRQSKLQQQQQQYAEKQKQEARKLAQNKTAQKALGEALKVGGYEINDNKPEPQERGWEIRNIAGKRIAVPTTKRKEYHKLNLDLSGLNEETPVIQDAVNKVDTALSNAEKKYQTLSTTPLPADPKSAEYKQAKSILDNAYKKVEFLRKEKNKYEEMLLENQSKQARLKGKLKRYQGWSKDWPKEISLRSGDIPQKKKLELAVRKIVSMPNGTWVKLPNNQVILINDSTRKKFLDRYPQLRKVKQNKSTGKNKAENLKKKPIALTNKPNSKLTDSDRKSMAKKILSLPNGSWVRFPNGKTQKVGADLKSRFGRIYPELTKTIQAV